MTRSTAYTTILCDDLPQNPAQNMIYHLRPKNADGDYYKERTDRNIGWITAAEQEALSSIPVSIAGCGGMGGQVAEKMLRLGIGEIRIADPEFFDVSNINRQFAARKLSVGVSKAFETARMLRDITDDSAIEVYGMGIDSLMLHQFLSGTAVVIDEIEFWNIGSCILMHQHARKYKVPILNALTVGFAAYVHLFTETSEPVEEMLGMSLEEGLMLERAVLNGTVTTSERTRIMDAALSCFIPDQPKYYAGKSAHLHQELVLDRLLKEGRAPIIATNPPFAGGLVADHALLVILEKLGLAEREITLVPPSPGYAKIDAATFTVMCVTHR